jgi:serine protease Do
VGSRTKLFGSQLGLEDETNDNTQPEESKLGVSVDALSADMAERLQLPANTKGVVVTDVKPGSFADDVGLARGMIILEVNKQPVTSVADFTRLTSTFKSGQDVVFLVRPPGRGGGTAFLGGTLP